ncbi:MAG: MBL fold metallo-hydrolase [Deltaproteobacteria bacterium]|nr:MBL fold metallo-hydrolase [Deltaproteobacteria bacterium]
MPPFGARAKGARRERVLGSPRFSEGSFRNTAGVGPGLRKGSHVPVIHEYLFGRGRRVPLQPLPSEDPRPSWARPPSSGLRATWLGHSTVLLELDGFRVLTDPVWGERASPSRLVGPKRFQPVPVAVSALPPIHAVVISHDHYDHLDYPTILELSKIDVPFVTSLGVGAHLEAFGVAPERIIELDWWESTELSGLSITAAPSQHFSGRGPTDRNRTLWSSMIVRGSRHSVFFSGDTGLTPEYAEITSKLGPFDLVMLEVGAFHPAWGDIHLGPDNALEALKLLGGGAFLPVHWGTFNLAIHAWDEPAERLVELAPKHGVQLVMPKLGACVEPAHVEAVAPWWREIALLEARSNVKAGESPDEPLGEPID